MAYSICLITGEYPPAVGGVADYTARLAGQLRERGHVVGVFTEEPKKMGPAARIDAEVAVHRVANWGPLSLLRVAKFLRAGHLDVVHLQYQAAPFSRSRLLHLLPALLRGMRVPAPMVTTFHDLRTPYLFPKAGKLRQRAVESLVNQSEGVIFTEASDLIAVSRSTGVAWIPIGANLEPQGSADRGVARARWRFGRDETVLAYFGFLNASKGVDRLVAAVRLLVDDGLPVRLMFIGDEQGASDPTNRETASRIRRQASELGLADRVTWTGWLSPRDVSQAMKAADMAVLPYIDGASLRRGSLLACLAHGLPVVTTRPASQPVLPKTALVPPFEQYEEFRLDASLAELVVPNEDSRLLVQAIGRIANDSERREQLSGAGRRLAERLAWPAIAHATEAFYERVLGSAPLEHVR